MEGSADTFFWVKRGGMLSPGGHDALGVGSVVIDETGCLSLDVEGEGVSILVLPARAFVDEAEGRIDIPGHGEITVGETVELGGGIYAPGSGADPVELDAPEGVCVNQRFWVVNSE